MVKLYDKLGFKGSVHIQVFGPDGRQREEETIHNIVTAVGDAHIADQLSSVPDEDVMGWMAIGTGGGAEAVGNTTLTTEVHRHALTSFAQGAGADDNDVIYIGDFGAGHATGAITEAGVFNAAAAGTLLCRALFAVKNCGALDTLKITWTFTCGAS